MNCEAKHRNWESRGWEGLFCLSPRCWTCPAWIFVGTGSCPCTPEVFPELLRGHRRGPCQESNTCTVPWQEMFKPTRVPRGEEGTWMCRSIPGAAPAAPEPEGRGTGTPRGGFCLGTGSFPTFPVVPRDSSARGVADPAGISSSGHRRGSSRDGRWLCPDETPWTQGWVFLHGLIPVFLLPEPGAGEFQQEWGCPCCSPAHRTWGCHLSPLRVSTARGSQLALR